MKDPRVFRPLRPSDREAAYRFIADFNVADPQVEDVLASISCGWAFSCWMHDLLIGLAILGDRGYITFFAVGNAYRRQGIGSRMLTELETWLFLRAALISVTLPRDLAPWFEKKKFVVDRYVTLPEHLLLLSKPLPEPPGGGRGLDLSTAR